MIKSLDSNYIMIHDEIERKTGFARGYELSKIVKKIKDIMIDCPDKKVIIKNTTEDLDFYHCIIKKIPTVYFNFDSTYAEKYSTNSLSEWNKFIVDNNISII